MKFLESLGLYMIFQENHLQPLSGNNQKSLGKSMTYKDLVICQKYLDLDIPSKTTLINSMVGIDRIIRTVIVPPTTLLQ